VYHSPWYAPARIFEYRPAMLHAKQMVVDGGGASVARPTWTSELLAELRNQRLVFDPVFAATVEEQFEKGSRESREITAALLAGRGFESLRVARLMSPLL
jgi:hypothetical protein